MRVVHENQVRDAFKGQMKQYASEMNQWHQGLDGGRKHELTARKHETQICYLIDLVDPSNLFDLSDRAAIRDTIDNKCKAKEWSASTSKLYFDSVSYFFQYLLENKSEIVTSECEFRLRNVVNSIPRWKTALRELVKEQKVSLHQRQKTLFHTKKDVEDFMNGNEFKSNADLIRRLSESETGFPLSPHQHLSLIRTLVTLVLLRSPKRAGILAHLDMEEYNKKSLVQEEYVIEVKKSNFCSMWSSPVTVN